MSSILLGSKIEVLLQPDVKNVVASGGPGNFMISENQAGVSNYARGGNDLIVELKDGRTVRIQGFFSTEAGVSNLVFVQDDGRWLVRFDQALSGADGVVDSLVTYEPLTDDASLVLMGILGAAAAGLGIAAVSGGGGGGGFSVPGPAFSLPVDTIAPSVPTVNPTSGRTLSGTAEPGSTIGIDTNGDGIPDVKVPVDAGGKWTHTPTTPLPEGTVVTITATDPAGNISPPTTTTVDTTAPSVPTVNPSNGTTLSGTAEPGSTIGIDTNGDGTPDVKVTVDAGGTWTHTPATALPEGTVVTVTATDPAGNISPSTTTTVDTTAPAAPIVNPSNGTTVSGTAEPGSSVAIDTNGDGTP
ncbi:hypothetical protein J2W28_006984, partial [Variovorax boronicumulans]